MRNKKNLYIIGAIVVGLIVLVIVVGKVKSLIRAWKEARDNKSEQQVLEAQGIKLTYPTNWYENKARELYNSMNTVWYDVTTYDTKEDRIVSIFDQLENNLDFIELDDAFGVRDNYDMQQWLDGDLSQWWKDQINGRLANSGITKRV